MSYDQDHGNHDPTDCPLAQAGRIAAGIIDESTPDQWLREACATMAERIGELSEEDLAALGSRLFHPSLSGNDDSRLGTVQSLIITEIGIRRIFDGI